MRALAIVPARGGSKRIPRKNIRLFEGRPIMDYAILAARESGCFAEIMVSTEDDEIAAVARAAGAEVPFRRSPAAADDFATTATVIDEVLTAYATRGQVFEAVCCLYPTAVLTTADRIREGREMLAGDEDLDAVLSVLPFSYPIQRALRVSNGRATMAAPEFVSVRSQDLEPMYRDAGQWYWLRTAPFQKSGLIFGDACGAVVLGEREAQDIDTEEDWRMAELKFRLRADA